LPEAAVGYGEALRSLAQLWREEPRLRAATLSQAGVFAAPLAGRIADRRGPQLTIWIGAVLVLVSWVIFGLIRSLSGLTAGVVLLDFGVQSALVSHRHVIYALRPEARSRLNTVFMTGMFFGGAVGSAVAIAAWRFGGWTAVTHWGAVTAAFVIALRLVRRV
jgi:MFS family permease